MKWRFVAKWHDGFEKRHVGECLPSREECARACMAFTAKLLMEEGCKVTCIDIFEWDDQCFVDDGSESWFYQVWMKTPKGRNRRFRSFSGDYGSTVRLAEFYLTLGVTTKNKVIRVSIENGLQVHSQDMEGRQVHQRPL